MLTLVFAAAVALNGLWDFRFEEQKSLEEVRLPGFEANDRMAVPGCWDVTSRYYEKRGTGCYRRPFRLDCAVTNAFLVIEGSALRSRYWIDGREIGLNVLPWSRVEFATGPLAAGPHEIVAAVDSTVDAEKTKLFANSYDFHAYGGFYHGVRLELQCAPVELRRIAVRTRDYRTGTVELEAIYAQEGPADFAASVAFDGKPAQDVVFRNRRATLAVPDFKLWSPDRPNLHTVRVTSRTSQTSQTSQTSRFGIRQVATARKRILLNGKPIYLLGVNRHEAHPEFGAATPRQVMLEDLQNLKYLGGNFIRGAHYPQCEEFLDLCDELGVLVWEESLGWGNTKKQFEDGEFCRLQEEQTRLMVRTSINHPSVIISGFLNEPDSGEPSCKELVDRLIALIRAEDTGHLVTFACHRTLPSPYSLEDISHANTDIIAYNAYPCTPYAWPAKTGSHAEMVANVREAHQAIAKRFREKYGQDKPIIVGETGTKALYGAHDARGRIHNSEDYQEEFTRVSLEEVFANGEIAGVALWQFVDSTACVRVGRVMDRPFGLNVAGLYDGYRRPKLAADAVRELFRSKKQED